MPIALTAASLQPFTVATGTTSRPARPDEISHPSQQDKLLDVQTPRNTIKVLITSNYVNFVTPPTTGQSIREDLVLTGLVVINLDSTRLTEKLCLRFIVEIDLVDSHGHVEKDIIYETCMEYSCSRTGYLLIAPKLSYFEYSFVVPSTIAPNQRTPFGKISHRLQADLVGRPTRHTLLGSFFRRASSGGLIRPHEHDEHVPPTMGDRARRRSFHSVNSDRQTESLHNDHLNHIDKGLRSISSSVPTSERSEKDYLEAEISAGVSWLNGNLSGSKEILISAIPFAVGTFPPPLELRERSLIRGLGTIPWSIFSQALNVGGALRFDMSLQNADLEPRCILWSVRLSIHQHVSITSPRRPQEGSRTSPTRIILLCEEGRLPTTDGLIDWYHHGKKSRSSDHGVLAPLWERPAVTTRGFEACSRDDIKRIIRLPTENHMQPTTVSETTTPITIRHELVLEFYYSVWREDAKGKHIAADHPGELRKATVKKQASVLPCLYTPKNFSLPTYEQSERNSNPTDERTCHSCACEEPLENLAEEEFARGFRPGAWLIGGNSNRSSNGSSRVKDVYVPTRLMESDLL